MTKLSALLSCLALIALLYTGCAKKVVAVHPGAISNYDSYAYDILTVEQGAINTAKAAFMAGTLPADAKDKLNAAIVQYNLTLAAWQGYHAAGGDSTALQQAIATLVSSVGALQAILHSAPSLMGPPRSAILMPGVIYG